jgi:hypothetical protein
MQEGLARVHPARSPLSLLFLFLLLLPLLFLLIYVPWVWRR